jgi:hypothetical protein
MAQVGVFEVEVTDEAITKLERDNDRWVGEIGDIRKVILREMTPKTIAEMIAVHFDEAPEDILDTAKALVAEFSRGYATTRADAHRWADDAFGV